MTGLIGRREVEDRCTYYSSKVAKRGPELIWKAKNAQSIGRRQQHIRVGSVAGSM